VLCTCALAPPLAAQEAPLDARSLPEWFGAPGMPGAVDDLHMGSGLPLTWMGLIAGGVRTRDGLLPAFAPWPGLDEVTAPLAWYDSAAVAVGEDAAWNGFSATLVELRTFSRPPRRRQPRAAFTYVNGSSAVDRASLFVQRGSEDGWVRGGTTSEDRSGSGLLASNGQHVWFAELGFRRGAHTLSGAFSQRGVAGTTRADLTHVDLVFGIRPPFSGFEESAHGEAGWGEWSWAGEGRSLRARFARSHDHRESFEPVLDDLFAERKGQRNDLVVEAQWTREDRERGLRLEGTDGDVMRTEDGFYGTPEVRTRQRTWWLAARELRPLLGGRLELQMGGGHVTEVTRPEERWQLAPSAVWRRGPATRQWRAHVGRIVTPVWSDLALGVTPFVQDTWAAGAGLRAGSMDRAWFDVSGMALETGNRALLYRQPVRDVPLRLGWTVEPQRVQDAMLVILAGARRGWWAVDGVFHTRVRPTGLQALVDAAQGARGGLEVRFRMFQNDLGIRLRGEAAWIGDRETESLPGYFTLPVPLPGYWTYGATATVELGDARMVFRSTNLADVAHQQVWMDPSSPFPGTPAVGSGQQFRFELSWPFYN
jgi:hypothetical protein